VTLPAAQHNPAATRPDPAERTAFATRPDPAESTAFATRPDPAESTAFATRPDPAESTAFAHASEAELARILDFYDVRWEYEPDTFPIGWSLEGEVVESFSPDFYLPDLEMYVELTTLKQSLVRKKNRKLRRLRELYPAVRIKLFYARDFRMLLLKFGRLALVDELSGTTGQATPPRRATMAQPGTKPSPNDTEPDDAEADDDAGAAAAANPSVAASAEARISAGKSASAVRPSVTEARSGHARRGRRRGRRRGSSAHGTAIPDASPTPRASTAGRSGADAPAGARPA
jgi:hypoxanthine phosphoribosyltransferase